MATGNGMKAPQGFVRIGAVADAPYFLLEAGNVVHGKLLGIFKRPDKRSKAEDGMSKFYQVELLSPCKVREGRGDDVEVREGAVGEIINLNYNPKTKELEPLCQEMLAGALYEVYAPCLGKIELANTNTMWNFDVSVKQIRKAKEQGPDFSDGPAAEAASE